jgi:hypothetical protein
MEASTLDALARDMTGLSHPIRIRTLVLLEYEYSPSELAKLINVPIGRVSYHVRSSTTTAAAGGATGCSSCSTAGWPYRNAAPAAPASAAANSSKPGQPPNARSRR